MNEKTLKFFKEHKSIFIISFILLILLSIFFISYNSKELKTKRYLKDISQELNDINLTLYSGIKDLTIDTNTTKDILSSGIESLNTLLLSTSEIDEVSDNISIIKSNLSTALTSTISLYDYNLTTLSNPDNIKDNNDLNKFNELKEECIANYLKLSENNININFSEETIQYFDNFSSYMNTLIKINRDSDFKNTQIKDFLTLLQSYKSDITYLNEDLSIAINKVREDKRDLQVIIDDIYKKEEIFNKIKENITFISIPEGCLDIYESLNEYLNSYYAYLMSLKEAVIYEKTAINVNELSDEISKNYKNSDSKRNDFLSAYKNYEYKLTNL